MRLSAVKLAIVGMFLMPRPVEARPLDPPFDCTGIADARLAAVCADADAGDTAAQTALAAALLAGKAVRRNSAAAIRLYRTAAEADHPPAQAQLGQMMAFGRWMPADPYAGRIWLRLADERGDAEAAFTLGSIHEMLAPIDLAAAARDYRRAIERGHAGAAFNLAVLIDSGQVSSDSPLAEAVALHRLAIERGHVQARFFLGRMYEAGRGVPRDPSEAARLFGEAAGRGDSWAAVTLAEMLERGRGVPVDLPEAMRLYEQAGAAGNDGAQFALGRLLAEGDPARARGWAERAAKQAPERVEYVLLLTELQLRGGAPEAALSQVKRIVDRHPEHAQAHDLLGDIYAALGERRAAQAAWRQAIELAERHPPAAPWSADAVRRKLAGGPA